MSETLSAENPKQTALKLAIQTSLASVVSMITSVPTSLVNASVLGPAGYGVIRVAEVIGSYAAYADLGLRYSLIRQVPLALGAGDQNEVETIKEVVFTWTWLVSGAIVVVLWALFSVGFTFQGLINLPNLTLVSLILITDRFNAYLHSLAKGVGRFDVVGRNTLALSIVTPLVVLPLVVLFGVTGFLLGQVLLNSCVTLFYTWRLRTSERIFVKLSLPIPRLLQLSKTGLLLWAVNLSETAYWTIDLTLLAIFLRAEDVGLFGFAVGLLNFAISVGNPFNMVAYRHMSIQRGAQKSKEDLGIFRKYLETPFVAYLLVISVALGFTFFGYELVVRLFLPKFVPALPVVKIVILGHMLFATTYFTGSVLNVADQLGKRLRIIWLGLALNGALDMLLLSQGFGIVGAAWGSTVSYVVYASVFLLSCMKLVYGHYRVGFDFLVRLLLVSSVLAFGIHVLDGWQISVSLREMPQILSAGIELAFAGLKTLLYASIALALYALLFAAYGPVGEIISGGRYIADLLGERIRQQVADA